MSELKVHKIGDLCFDFKMGKDVGIDFYLKSEADKVIAEKDKEIAELEKKREYTIEHTAEVINAQEREIRHHKYRRCLDQVENCRTSSVYFFRISEGEKDEGKAAEYRRVSDWFDKWEERWLELAEKFKEAK